MTPAEWAELLTRGIYDEPSLETRQEFLEALTQALVYVDYYARAEQWVADCDHLNRQAVGLP